jgi:hypothetical protein
VAARKHQVEDFDLDYGLYVDGSRVASFAVGRIGYREWHAGMVGLATSTA